MALSFHEWDSEKGLTRLDVSCQQIHHGQGGLQCIVLNRSSSQWFRILNGSQKTIVALDNPDSFGLVRTVVEQLATSERVNWKVVILLRNEKEEIFNKFSSNKSFDDKLVLAGLNEGDSQQLVSSIVGNDQDPGWLHRVYNFTKGNPGWLCLIAELAKQGRLLAKRKLTA